MAKQVKLSARPRADVGRNSVKHLRTRGVVPAVIYGHKDQPKNLEINERDISALLSHAVGENILVELEISGGATKALPDPGGAASSRPGRDSSCRFP